LDYRLIGLKRDYVRIRNVLYIFRISNFHLFLQIKLKQHEKSHSWKQVYDCPKCDKKFGNSSNRDKHIRAIHEKIKPYKCTICNFQFSDPSNLKKHLLSHTKERLYKCTVDGCDHEEFSSGLEVRQHMWRTHKIHSTDTIVSQSANEVTEVSYKYTVFSVYNDKISSTGIICFLTMYCEF